MALTNEVNALHFEYVDETKANTIQNNPNTNLRAKDIWKLNTVYCLQKQQQQKTRMI